MPGISIPRSVTHPLRPGRGGRARAQGRAKNAPSAADVFQSTTRTVLNLSQTAALNHRSHEVCTSSPPRGYHAGVPHPHLKPNSAQQASVQPGDSSQSSLSTGNAPWLAQPPGVCMGEGARDQAATAAAHPTSAGILTYTLADTPATAAVASIGPPLSFPLAPLSSPRTHDHSIMRPRLHSHMGIHPVASSTTEVSANLCSTVSSPQIPGANHTSHAAPVHDTVSNETASLLQPDALLDQNHGSLPQVPIATCPSYTDMVENVAVMPAGSPLALNTGRHIRALNIENGRKPNAPSHSKFTSGIRSPKSHPLTVTRDQQTSYVPGRVSIPAASPVQTANHGQTSPLTISSETEAAKPTAPPPTPAQRQHRLPRLSASTVLPIVGMAVLLPLLANVVTMLAGFSNSSATSQQASGLFPALALPTSLFKASTPGQSASGWPAQMDSRTYMASSGVNPGQDSRSFSDSSSNNNPLQSFPSLNPGTMQQQQLLQSPLQQGSPTLTTADSSGPAVSSSATGGNIQTSALLSGVASGLPHASGVPPPPPPAPRPPPPSPPPPPAVSLPPVRKALEWDPLATSRVVTIVSRGVPSPYKTTWDVVVEQTSKRLYWTNTTYQMLVFYEDELAADEGKRSIFLDVLSQGTQILVGIDIRHPGCVSFLTSKVAQLPGVRLFLGGSDAAALSGQGSSSTSSSGGVSSSSSASSSSGVSSGSGVSSSSGVGSSSSVSSSSSAAVEGLQMLSSLQGLEPFNAQSFRTIVAKAASFLPDGKSLAVAAIAQELWGRYSSEDFLFIFLVLINQYVTPVAQVASTSKGMSPSSLWCILTNCGSQVYDCVSDPTCKAGLDCLNSCSFNDQVCQYRCIVSHESPKFERFALCILQKHNCRGLSATAPALPDPAPIATFRGEALTHEIAEDIFVGHMKARAGPDGNPAKDFSWLVAGGKNPAYDYFPCQYQLFSQARGSSMWYEPVFRVIKLDGVSEWRRRRYRVKRAQVPGTFTFTVLDNGVTSNEYWRIIDVADDLSHALFYYSGAASAAGLSYSGAVLATVDGLLPKASALPGLYASLATAGIEPWELSQVDNSQCAGAPLNLAALGKSIA